MHCSLKNILHHPMFSIFNPFDLPTLLLLSHLSLILNSLTNHYYPLIIFYSRAGVKQRNFFWHPNNCVNGIKSCITSWISAGKAWTSWFRFSSSLPCKTGKRLYLVAFHNLIFNYAKCQDALVTILKQIFHWYNEAFCYFFFL